MLKNKELTENEEIEVKQELEIDPADFKLGRLTRLCLDIDQKRAEMRAKKAARKAEKENREKKELSTPAKIGIGAVCGAILAGTIGTIMMKKATDWEETNEDDVTEPEDDIPFLGETEETQEDPVAAE